MADGKVVFEIVGDSTNIDSAIKGVTKTIKDESAKWDSSASGSMKNIEEVSKSTSGTISAVFEGAFMAITASIISATGSILSAIGEWALAAIDMASNLEEVQNVVDVTFGAEGSKKIDEWSKKAGAQFGLTELQAKKFTSTMGAMLKSSGLTGDEIVTMSEDMAGLAADMASFYNLDFDEAFAKIRSGISGETEPLKQLGINLSVANLEAYAFSQGIETAYEDMSQAEQVMLRYNYLLNATTDAQGDFVRTSGDSYANMGRQIETQAANLQQTAGEKMLPLAKEFREDWLNFLKLLNGDNSIVVTGTESQLTEWISQETGKIEEAKTKLDSISEQWAEGFNMEYGVYDQNLYGSFGEYFYETLQAQQPFAGGKQRERIDSILSEMDTAYAQIGESEAKVADFEAQLNQIMEETPDTTANGAKVVSDIVAGMDSQAGSVQAEVDLINGILSGLGNVGTGTPNIIPQHETGLNYVPFDGYLASLHQGEGILTAEENRIWQRFRNGQPSNIDYDALGGVMRDNVKAGGNVYLDGRTVGQVISDIQGRSYKTLQRSGWQG